MRAISIIYSWLFTKQTDIFHIFSCNRLQKYDIMNEGGSSSGQEEPADDCWLCYVEYFVTYLNNKLFYMLMKSP